METLIRVNYLIAFLFTICYLYQYFYICIALVKKPKNYSEFTYHRFAVMISARNEQSVIAQLIHSIKAQNYPAELVDVYVVADNCTDETAAVAREAGAYVYERFDQEKRGKGYALDYLFDQVRTKNADTPYDGYFIFDADNLLDENYIYEMNKTFSNGYKIITCYRNSKNYGTNWISAGYSLWFLREAKYLNNARMIMNTSCAVSGTGFLVSEEIVERNNGWHYFLLTEDIEFTIDSCIQGEKIGYCDKAVIYDEQPVTFATSWRQRLRWAKGYLQVFQHYGKKLFLGCFKKKNFFSCVDMTMTIMPAVILLMLCVLVNIGALIVGLFLDSNVELLARYAVETVRNAYLVLLAVGGITCITEWSNINCSAVKKILYLFTFPIFLFTYIPISLVALFKKIEWKPIDHNISITLDEIRQSKQTKEPAQK